MGMKLVSSSAVLKHEHTELNSQATPPGANGAFVHPLGAIKLPPTWEDKHLPEHWPLSGTISFQEMGPLGRLK